MKLLLLKIAISGVFFSILIHAYLSTKYLTKKTLGYFVLYIGVFLASSTVFFFDRVQPILLMALSMFTSLLGTGLIVRNIKQISIRDFLTGLYTRVYFYSEWLPREMKRQERMKGQIVFIMMDIDNFKMLNDNHGHRFGDCILRKVSEVILTDIRASDIAVRFGGDEILIALPSTSLREAKNVSTRIIEKIKKLKLKNSELITLSVGMSIWKVGEDVNKVLDEADNKMYKHKTLKKVIGIVGEENIN